MSNLRPGIDDNFGDFALLVRLDVPFDDRAQMIAALQALEAVRRDKLDPARTFGVERYPDGTHRPRTVVGEHRLGMLLGFGLRFFLGPLAQRGTEEGVPNFPPGGSFVARTATRFGITDRFVPMYLRTMAAGGDTAVIEQQLTRAAGGKAPAPADVAAAYQAWLATGESDLFLQLDSENQYLVVELWEAIVDRVVTPFGLQVRGIERGFARGDGKAHIGFFDGTSDLDRRMREDPQWYRSRTYLPVPAAAYPGAVADARQDADGTWRMVRDDPRYDGGTYLAYRKYAFDLKRWFAKDFQVTDFHGRAFHGAEGRLHAIGRDPDSGRVISRASHRPLEPEPDHTDINLGFDESHALKARGGTPAPFTGPFPPVPIGHSNTFTTQDIRIRRRSIAYGDVDPATGAIEWGLHFICFQNNIQQTGFEFINNIWLVNPDFRRSVDGLMNPVGAIVVPRMGAYYFVPPEQHAYAGDVLFE